MEAIEHNGHTIQVFQDEDPMNPRTEFDNLATFVCFHGRYDLGDEEHGYNKDDFISWNDLREQIEKDHDPVVIVPLYLFDHSGLSLASDSSTFSACDSHGWDWGQVGWAFIPKNIAHLDDETIETCQKVLQGEVETYGQYLSGDVWCFTAPDGEDDTETICGIFGYDEAVEDAKMHVDAIFETEEGN